MHQHVQRGPLPARARPGGARARAARHAPPVARDDQKVSDDFGRRHTFNTAIAAVMELMNALAKFDDRIDAGPRRAARSARDRRAVLAPIMPHACHALWQELGHERAVIDERWPEPDARALVRDSVEVVVQVNGKLRGRVTVPANADEAEVREAALADEGVQRFIDGKAIRKFVYVPGKLANVVV